MLFLFTFLRNRTRQLSMALSALSAVVIAYPADIAKENVVITDENVEYLLSAKNGKLSSIKKRRQSTLTAVYSDDNIMFTAFYGNGISIDKASAPGCKPVYRSWEPGDIFYSGSRICALPIKLSKGKPTKVTIEQTYSDPWRFSTVFLPSPYLSSHSVTTIKVPPELKKTITITPMGLTDKMEFKCSENSDGSVTYTVEARDTPPFRDEEHAPLDGIDAPQLILSGYYDGVSQLYAHLKSFIEEESENETVEIDSIANRLDNGNGNIYATIDSIASWVRDNIRYVGIEHGDYGIKPAKASKVLSDRFGDCKGSANLIKAMLLSLRIDSRLAWIGTKGSVNHRWDEITSISAGNHVIATAMLSDTIIFIDGTAAGYPTDALPPTIKGQQALIEDGDSYILAVVPDHGHKNDCDSTKTIMAIEGENLTGHTCHKLTGAMKGMFTGMYRTANPIMQEKLARHLLTAPKKNVRCENLSVSTPTSSSKSITLSADVTEYGSARKIGSKIYIDLRPLRDILSFTVDTENRYRGVSIPHPYRYAAHYELKLPEGHTAVSLPENKTIDTPWHEGKISYSLSGDTVVCEAELSTFRTNASIDELHEWNNAIRSIRKYSETPIVLSLTD